MFVLGCFDGRQALELGQKENCLAKEREWFLLDWTLYSYFYETYYLGGLILTGSCPSLVCMGVLVD